jgi:hypothetical protein
LALQQTQPVRNRLIGYRIVMTDKLYNVPHMLNKKPVIIGVHWPPALKAVAIQYGELPVSGYFNFALRVEI